MNLVTTLSDRIGVLEADLLKTKKTYSSAYTKLIPQGLETRVQIKSGKQGNKLGTEHELFLQESDSNGSPFKIKRAVGKASDEKLVRLFEESTAIKKFQLLVLLRQERAMDEAKTTKKIDWNDPSVIRYHSLKMKPKTIAQGRRNMIKYLKNQGNYKINDFKGMSYNDIRPSLRRKVTVPPEKERSTEKIVEEEVVTQEEREEVVKEPGAKRKKGDGSLKNYKIFTEMLRDFDRHDVEELYRLVKESLFMRMESNSYVDRKEISFKPRDDLQDVEEEIRG
ncbi:hypothetical protein Tco_0277574 [Tanacetum coccineum]